MKCKNGHEFDFPAYITQQVRTGIPFIADKGPVASRYDISYPVCPFCQVPIYVVEAPAKKKASVVRRKPSEQTPVAPTSRKTRTRRRKKEDKPEIVEEEPADYDVKAQEEHAEK